MNLTFRAEIRGLVFRKLLAMRKKPGAKRQKGVHGFLLEAPGGVSVQRTRGAPSLVLGVEGVKVSPSSFEVLPTLEFVHSFLALMGAVAEHKKKSLRLTGLQIKRGSTEFAIEAPESDVPEVQGLAEESFLLVGEKNVPPHYSRKVYIVRGALVHLPANHRAYLGLRDERKPLPTKFPEPDVYRETTSVRARIELAGGADPYVRVHLENNTKLSLRANRSLVKKAGQHLYQWIDAVVHLTWEGDSVQEAELADFEVIPDMEPEAEIMHWKGWFSRVGQGWEAIDDIEGELDCEEGQ